MKTKITLFLLILSTAYSSILYATNEDVIASDITFASDFYIVNENTATVDVVLNLNSPSTGSTQVDVAVTLFGTAINGQEYSFTNQTVSFPLNSTSQTLTIPIINNSTFKGDTYFVLTLWATLKLQFTF